MIHNKHTLSTARHNREKQLSDRDPLFRIGTLINAYHSVDLRPVSDSVKKDFKQQVDREIKRQLKYVSEDIHGQVKASLKSKAFWETFRDRIMS